MFVSVPCRALRTGGFPRRLGHSAAPQFDYIIVGAGSAGCVLANRLTADSSNRVLLVEAGPENTALSLKMPAMMLNNINGTKHNWAFKSESEPHLNGRVLKHDRGKTLGGSSSINGMVWIRGHPLDFDGWQERGCDGWSYADVLPYFKRLESYSGGADTYRGGEGPMKVLRPAAEDPLSKAFLEAGAQAGYPLTDDTNGYKQEGFGVFDRTVHGGERWSAARGYLDEARIRPNLEVLTGSLVERLTMDGKLVTGLTYNDSSGQRVEVGASKSVILSAGAVGTPHLLMLSGLGPAAHLAEKGIPLVVDLPGVGANLNDHPDLVLKYKCTQPVTLWPKTKPLASIAAGVQWLLTREGICGSNHFDVVANVRSSPELRYPDLQFCLSPIAMDHDTFVPMNEHAFQLHVGLMNTHSRGRIELVDANPHTPPSIVCNYLEDHRDREAIRKGIRMLRELVKQPAFVPLTGAEVFPGEHAQSDEALDKEIEDNLASQWHLSGTARMGRADDEGAVVDAGGCVHGVEGLRVVDASVMPFATNGNTNSPTIMIAEKMSDAILGQTLDKMHVDVWSHEG